MTGIPLDGSIPRAHVPNALLREAFFRDGRSAEKIAEALGHFRYETGARKNGSRRVRGDASAVRRALGLSLDSGRGRYRRYMKEYNALRYAKVLGLDPHEIGL